MGSVFVFIGHPNIFSLYWTEADRHPLMEVIFE